MKGNIYTIQKCPVCGGKMIHQERQNNCLCENCGIPASGGYYVRFGRDICKRFKNDYAAAAQFLNGIRFKTAEGSFDIRDYQKGYPLGFLNQAEKWLDTKKGTVAESSYRNLKNYMFKAMDAWGNMNVKEIRFGHIEDFLFDSAVVQNDKTRANMKSCLHSFFVWVGKREEIPVPNFPECNFELGTRKITDWETQTKILDEIYRLTYHMNPKTWLAIDMLTSYVQLRPGDLLRITEGDINEKHASIIIRNPTKLKNKFKVVRLSEEHAQLISELKEKYPALPHISFFRHVEGLRGTKGNSPFGKSYLYNWWKKACQNLGVEGLDMYGGTRHTTTTELAREVGTDGARKATGHETNKAFDRYCQYQDDTSFEMAKIAIQKKRAKKAEIVDLKNKKKC